jgi:hypothetical protein
VLQPYIPSSNEAFPCRHQPEPYDFGANDGQEWFVDNIIGHGKDDKKGIQFHVCWSISNTTWETVENCRELAALD